MTSRPNILLLMGDEHAPMASSTWGGEARTPALDGLSQEGAAFEAAYCNAPLCVPSRMSMLTGRYAHRIGSYDLASVLGSDVPTIAHALRAVGYDAVLAGKQHFVGPDQLHGFRTQLARDAHVGEHPLRAWPDDQPGPTWEHPLDAGPGETDLLRADDEVEEAASTYISAAAGHDDPWFLCASFIAPHWPYVVPEEYWERYPEGSVSLPEVEDPRDQHPAINRLRDRLGVGNYDERTTRRARAAYFGAISHLDDRVGRLLDVLEESGQSGSTLVVYVSDHGGMLGEHGLWRKMNFYEEAVRVPMVLRWPGVIPPGVRPEPPVSLVDLAPTLLSAAGAERLDSSDGQDLLPVITSSERARDVVFSEYLGHGVAAPVAMVRRGRWKLVYYHGESPQLFDLVDDPGEVRDRGDDPECRHVRDRLTSELRDMWDPVEIDHLVRRSQAERLLIRRAESTNPSSIPQTP